MEPPSGDRRARSPGCTEGRDHQQWRATHSDRAAYHASSNAIRAGRNSRKMRQSEREDRRLEHHDQRKIVRRDQGGFILRDGAVMVPTCDRATAFCDETVLTGNAVPKPIANTDSSTSNPTAAWQKNASAPPANAAINVPMMATRL